MSHAPSPHIILSRQFEELEDPYNAAQHRDIKPLAVLQQDGYRIPILQADKHFLCVDKPPFLRIDAKEEVEDDTRTWTVESILRLHLMSQSPSNPAASLDGPLANITSLKQTHQLDANTSGIFLYAKHKSAASEAGHLFQDRLVRKTYLAIVNGHVDVEGLLSHALSGSTIAATVPESTYSKGKNVAMASVLRIDSYIQALSAHHCEVVAAPELRSSCAAGKGHPQQASTLLRPLRTFTLRATAKQVTLVHLKPLTGRRHQLRVHCAAIGHAILGDWAYEAEPTRDCGRMFLHAFQLEMKFPDNALLEGKAKRRRNGKLDARRSRSPVDYVWRSQLPFLDILAGDAVVHGFC